MSHSNDKLSRISWGKGILYTSMKHLGSASAQRPWLHLERSSFIFWRTSSEPRTGQGFKGGLGAELEGEENVAFKRGKTHWSDWSKEGEVGWLVDARAVQVGANGGVLRLGVAVGKTRFLQSPFAETDWLTHLGRLETRVGFRAGLRSVTDGSTLPGGEAADCGWKIKVGSAKGLLGESPEEAERWLDAKGWGETIGESKPDAGEELVPLTGLVGGLEGRGG